MYAFLLLAAVVAAFFVAIFAVGALVGLVGLAAQVLRAPAKTWEVKAQPALAEPWTRPVRQPDTVWAETVVDAVAVRAAS